MTTYIPAYDTEQDACLAGVKEIVRVHEAFEIPATFFVVAKLLEDQGDDYLALVGNHPLFEIASHSYTHMLLRDHPRSVNPAGPTDQHHREIVESKIRIEDHFGCEVKGFRPPWCFEDGFNGAPDLLGLCREAGYRYISSVGWGPKSSLPAPNRKSFDYGHEGFPDLLEIPGSGWHENVLKGQGPDFNDLQGSQPAMPDAYIEATIDTPAQEFRMNRVFIDDARAKGIGHVTLIWHPWSLLKFDPHMKMLDQTFQYVREQDLEIATFEDYYEAARSEFGDPAGVDSRSA